MEVTSRYNTPYNPDMPPDWKQHNKGVTPIFSIEPVPLFEADGKTPRLGPDGKASIDVEFVRLLVAGDGLAEGYHRAEDSFYLDGRSCTYKERFADEYAAWKENRELAHQGFSLEEWPPLFGKPKLINELNANNMFSVKDVAAVTDGNLYCVPHLRELREKAIAYLADKEGHAVTDKLAEQNAQMQGELEAMRRQIAKLTAAPPKRKSKRRVSPETREKLRAINLAKNAVRNAPKPPSDQPSPEQAA